MAGPRRDSPLSSSHEIRNLPSPETKAFFVVTCVIRTTALSLSALLFWRRRCTSDDFCDTRPFGPKRAGWERSSGSPALASFAGKREEKNSAAYRGSRTATCIFQVSRCCRDNAGIAHPPLTWERGRLARILRGTRWLSRHQEEGRRIFRPYGRHVEIFLVGTRAYAASSNRSHRRGRLNVISAGRAVAFSRVRANSMEQAGPSP